MPVPVKGGIENAVAVEARIQVHSLSGGSVDTNLKAATEPDFRLANRRRVTHSPLPGNEEHRPEGVLFKSNSAR